MYRLLSYFKYYVVSTTGETRKILIAIHVIVLITIGNAKCQFDLWVNATAQPHGSDRIIQISMRKYIMPCKIFTSDRIREL